MSWILLLRSQECQRRPLSSAALLGLGVIGSSPALFQGQSGCPLLAFPFGWLLGCYCDPPSCSSDTVGAEEVAQGVMCLRSPCTCEGLNELQNHVIWVPVIQRREGGSRRSWGLLSWNAQWRQRDGRTVRGTCKAVLYRVCAQGQVCSCTHAHTYTQMHVRFHTHAHTQTPSLGEKKK